MASVLASSVVDRGFEPRSPQTKDYKIGICYFCAKNTARLVGSESESCVRVVRHVNPRTIVSVG